MRSARIGNTLIEIKQCDITKENVDVIVNAANSHLAHGGGVALAISMAGGDVIDKESREYIQKHGPLNTGDVAVTSAGRLNARFVIHAVGPVWGEGKEDEKLSRAFENALKKADELNLKSITFPAISSGIYGFPKDRCARIFYEVVKRYFSRKSSIELVRMCLYSKEELEVFERVFDSIGGI
ncbi:MAG: Appr-1-p processing protein [Mesoaciditoga sp.]|uniref:macro domain-containing protein n=1 Tax=Athalassotoga sp. TaxID=2022597 RepID=UPI000CB58FED|nr:MAG: Appr-1-p processing protein [Mesoaciditoga sp.]PMP79774.1 MAG: Appr-1-p processing protein [Mesoaciditoga sp.]HEU24095.1 macro domain-containing protein [Mesoaciditoga lauensis]